MIRRLIELVNAPSLAYCSRERATIRVEHEGDGSTITIEAPYLRGSDADGIEELAVIDLSAEERRWLAYELLSSDMPKLFVPVPVSDELERRDA